MSDAKPPRAAEWLLESALGSDAGGAAIGDLNEEFEHELAGRGRRGARLWYWKQTVSLLGGFWRARAGRPRRDVPRTSRNSWSDVMGQDLRYAFRALRVSPMFTAIAIAVLALGIGATSAIFSFVDGVLLRPLPYADPSGLVAVWERPPGATRNGISALNFLDWQHDNTVFESIAASVNGSPRLSTAGDPVQVKAARVSAPYFDLFGVKAAIGRTFAAGEDQPGHENVAVLTHRLWQSQFSGDASIVGRTIQLDNHPYTVIGVLPAGSPFERGYAQLWRPLAFSPSERTRNYHWLRVAARLKHGVTFEQAQANMDAIGARIARDYPDSNKDWGVHLDRLNDIVVSTNLRTSLNVLLAAVGLLLLLGCANLANLSLARGAAREREVLVRAALGASRGRIVRQFLTESLVLAAVGGGVGIAVGFLMMRGLNALLPPFYLPREAVVAMDWRALTFAAAVSIATGVLFGMAPAFQATRLNLAGSMRSGTRSATSDLGGRRLRDGLVVAEVAIACLLLAGAGLLGRSFFAMQQVEAARDPDRVLTAGLDAAKDQFGTPDQARAYYREILERVSALPGVSIAALTSALPLEGWTDGMPFKIAGRPDLKGSVGFKRITPSYFATIGLPILRGRGLTDQDRHGTTPAIVVDERFANRYFPDRDPIGQHLLMEEVIPGQPALGPEIPWEIVGVVKNERANTLSDEGFPGSYASIEQAPTYGLAVALRSAADPSSLGSALRGVVKEIDPTQPVTEIRTVSDIKSEYVAPDRLRTLLLWAFSGLALLLAAVGIYGVISYSVTQRTREIGIRTALGATRAGILALVLRHASVTIALGLTIGIGATLGLTRLMANLLFGVTPRDPASLLFAAAILSACALLAAYMPARRAAGVDPITALRVD